VDEAPPARYGTTQAAGGAEAGGDVCGGGAGLAGAHGGGHALYGQAEAAGAQHVPRGLVAEGSGAEVPRAAGPGEHGAAEEEGGGGGVAALGAGRVVAEGREAGSEAAAGEAVDGRGWQVRGCEGATRWGAGVYVLMLPGAGEAGVVRGGDPLLQRGGGEGACVAVRGDEGWGRERQ
jgi:hypothetical protein